jgi:hypothetical protein
MSGYLRRRLRAGKTRPTVSLDRPWLEVLEDRTLLSVNPIVAENQLPGTPQSVWDVSTRNAGDPTIQGYATDISYNHGQTVSFKINDTAKAPYTLDIYRMGYYQGNGARLVGHLSSSQTVAKVQPAPITDAGTGLVDAGNWSVTASWAIPANAVSGIYFAHVIRTDTGGDSHIMFIVRDDNDPTPSDLLFQTSDATWQAYNTSLGGSLYDGGVRTNGPYAGAYKVSYDRPFDTRTNRSVSWVFNAEYPMVRWLEANGYNVSYFTDMDADRFGAQITQHKVYLSVGHDEYWSGQQRANVEAALASGVNLAFFSGNEVFWKTYWAPSIDGSNTSYRTLVCYKETFSETQIDPNQIWTGTWRDPTLSPPLDGGRPENALTGTLFMVNGNRYDAISVPGTYAGLRFWRNTAIANLAPGSSYTLPSGTLGYEWDVVPDNGYEPPGSINLSSTTISVTGQYLLDYGGTFGAGTATHSLHLYRNPTSKALVFGAGTVQWSWGLDGHHDNNGAYSTTDVNMQQATVNLFADMGAQPGSLQSGLVAAVASTDTTPPTSVITAPANGKTFLTGAPVTITGTATDAGGGVVAGVEVSIDGGQTWHATALTKPASSVSWSYTWTPAFSGTYVIRSRAVDDSGNLETPAAGVTVTVIGQGATLWSSAANPQAISTDASSVEVGVKFYAGVSGSIAGIRFYKGAGNTGTHVGNLWGSTGQLLATATFTNETASGWQQVNFSTPVAVTANTTYVASYFAPVGHYAQDKGYFNSTGADGTVLHAPATGAVAGGNGVYAYGASSSFPSQTYNGSNYWVDVVFAAAAGPTVTATTPAAGASQVNASAAVAASFNQALDPTTLTGSTFYLADPSGNVVAASVSYNASTFTATLTPKAALSPVTTYTATVVGGASGVKNVSGVPMPGNTTWSFTVDGPAPAVTSVTPAAGATGVSTTAVITVTFSHAMTAATLTTATMGAQDAHGTVVPVTISYNPNSFTATLTPSGFFAPSTTYTVTVAGGSGGAVVQDANGRPLAATVTFSFTTVSQAPFSSIWSNPPAPAAISTDASSVEVGVKFYAGVSGSIAGIRFYKGAGNTGTHVGNLWGSTGQLLATATFTNETASGWQQVNFSTPVAVTANTTYVASYFAPVGHYAQDLNFFNAGVDSGPLHAPSTGSAGGNGVYAYGASSSFPSQTYNGSNYWVDVVFSTAPAVTAVTPAAGATGVSRTTAVKLTFDRAMDPTTITASTFLLKDANGNTVAATVTYDPTTFTVTLTPSAPLAANTTYTAKAVGSGSGPRIKDAYGNLLATDYLWSFTTGSS